MKEIFKLVYNCQSYGRKTLSFFLLTVYMNALNLNYNTRPRENNYDLILVSFFSNESCGTVSKFLVQGACGASVKTEGAA